MLNAAAASAYGHKKVEPEGGGTCWFQESREPFQSGTRPVTRTNLVLIRLKGSECREGQMSLSPPDWMTGEEEIYRDLTGMGAS
jgi:hypothetical protein